MRPAAPVRSPPATPRRGPVVRIAARAYGHEAVRRVLRPLARVPGDRRWIFVLGCYASGSTMLHDVLAGSELCASLPGEGARFTSELLTPEEVGWTRLWLKVADQIRTGTGDPERVKRDWCIWLRTGKPVFVEKSVCNAVRIDWLARNFPSPFFVHIIRNGYAVSEGNWRRAGAGSHRLPDGMSRYPIEWCAEQWVASNEVIDRDLASFARDNHIQVRYEALCAEPRATIQHLGDVLGLPDLVDRLPIAIRDQNPGAIERLDRSQLDAINSVAGGSLKDLGYEVL